MHEKESDMFVNQVAIVSQSEGAPFEKVSLVSAAIQRQVSRELKRFWNLDATVDAFARLQDVPLGYWRVVIRDNIQYDALGIHLNRADGQPYALVRYSDQWSVTVSHETLEMLVDPFGRRVVPGQSVHPEQGRVDYLVEIC